MLGEFAPCLALPAGGRDIDRVAGRVLLPAAGQDAQVHDRYPVARGPVFRVSGQSAPDDRDAWVFGQISLPSVLPGLLGLDLPGMWWMAAARRR